MEGAFVYSEFSAKIQISEKDSTNVKKSFYKT